MKNSLTNLRLAMLAVFVSILITEAYSQEPVCNPIFSEIFNFNVGDIFFYQSSFSYSDGTGIPTLYHGYFSFEIIEKSRNGDTSIYIIDGAIPPSIALGNYCDKDLGICEEQIVDTLILIDSSSHYLNQCADSWGIINLPEEDSIYADLSIRTYKDTIIGKEIWNYYRYNEDNEFWEHHILNADGYTEFYAPVFGLIEMYATYHEASYGFILYSCIIGGDTIVLNDLTDLPQPIAQEIKNIKVYPNPAGEQVTIVSNSGIPFRSIALRTINGVTVRIESYSEFSDQINLNIGDLPKGLYLLEIIAGDTRSVRLLVHQ